MNNSGNNNPKNPIRTYANDNILESLRSVGNSVGKSVVTDAAAKIGADAFASLFGSIPPSENYPDRGQLAPEKQNEQPRQAPRQEAALQPIYSAEEAKLKQEIEGVRHELKALSASLKSLHTEIHNTIEAAPVNPGVYHINFYDRLRNIIEMLRQQVDDSRNWLQLFNSRKKKVGYWGMYKKHGTTFGLSNERSIATSAG